MLNKMKLLGNLKHGLLFIVSAPAGTGKTTLVHMLTDEFPCVVTSVSFTTRAPRPGEVNGKDYHFITKEEFERKIGESEFLEHVRLYDDYYGTSVKWVQENLESGKHVILVIDTQGGLLLKGKIPATFIFLKPPSLQELKSRLEKRKTESQAVIEQRLDWAKKEMRDAQYYDYLIINDDLATAYQTLRSIFIAEEHKVTNLLKNEV